MGEPNWGLITSDATFEALVTALVFFEDPRAALFGRRGKDGGQDVRSGDGQTVYQCKFHQGGSTARAMADARTEAEKIGKYRQPKHERYGQWQGVTHWRLVTNAAFNPTDKQKWDDEIVPLFTAQGLGADFWGQADLNVLLVKHPEVQRAFFEGETRVLLSLPEARDAVLQREPFLQRTTLGTFFGRQQEIAQARDFLASDKHFLVVHGAGGIGKTRLLVEIGEEVAKEGDWQVLWANVGSMTVSSNWFQAIAPERKTLLLVDDPPDAELLMQLTEQLGVHTGRMTQWKIVVAVRSPNDPVLRFLQGPRMQHRVRGLPIDVPSIPDAESICGDLMASGPLANRPEPKRQEIATELAQRFQRFPVWLTLAVRELETRGDLSNVSQTSDSLAAQYMDEIVQGSQNSSSSQVLSLLRWVALLGTVNRDDEGTMKLLASICSMSTATDVKVNLKRLVDRRVLFERGANNRLVELKPDVLRDHVLLKWLACDTGYGPSPIVASNDAMALVTEVCKAVVDGNINPWSRAILVALGRTELLLRLADKSIGLLDQFFAGVRSSVSVMSASRRIALAELLVSIAQVRPVDTVSLVRTMREAPVEQETCDNVFGTRILSRNDVVLELAWPVLHAATGAVTDDEKRVALAELCALTEEEAEIGQRLSRGLPNDGRRAAELLEQVIEGGRNFPGDFHGAAKKQAEEVLNEVATRAPSPGKKALLHSLVRRAVAMERTQVWFDPGAAHFDRNIVTPGSTAWTTREEILKRIRDILAVASTPSASRIELWHVLAESHRDVGRCQSIVRDEQMRTTCSAERLGNLNWAHSVLSSRESDIAELTAARALWKWHLRFGTDQILRTAATQLDRLYNSDSLASEFEPLLTYEEGEPSGQVSTKKARALAEANSCSEIDSFVDRAIRFTGQEESLHYGLVRVAQSLGEHATTHEGVRAFVAAALSAPTISVKLDFGALIAVNWLATLRNGPTPADACVKMVELMALCSGDEQRRRLVIRAYGRVPRPQDVGELTPEEHHLLRGLGHLFLVGECTPRFIKALAPTLHYEWPALKPIIEQAVSATSPEQVTKAVEWLIDGVYWALCPNKTVAPPEGLGVWLLEQLLCVPDLDNFDGSAQWSLEQIFKKVDKAPLSWLPRALARRRAMEQKTKDGTVRAVSHHARLPQYVASIEASTVIDLDTRQAVEALVDLAEDSSSVGYYLPTILHDIDPDGLMIPAEVARRIAGATTSESRRRFARIGSAYDHDSAAWRTMAKPALAAATKAIEQERLSLFIALVCRDFQVKGGVVDAISVAHQGRIVTVKQALEVEADDDFKPFWQWLLAGVEGEQRMYEEWWKEERGE